VDDQASVFVCEGISNSESLEFGEEDSDIQRAADSDVQWQEKHVDDPFICLYCVYLS
jgi:hypothetical protein